MKIRRLCGIDDIFHNAEVELDSRDFQNSSQMLPRRQMTHILNAGTVVLRWIGKFICLSQFVMEKIMIKSAAPILTKEGLEL